MLESTFQRHIIRLNVMSLLLSFNILIEQELLLVLCDNLRSVSTKFLSLVE